MARSAMCDKKPFVNPKGIASLSPGLARFREGLPWVATFNFRNPERVESQRLATQIQPLQGCDFSLSSPRVARGAQPWAESFNPVRIENQWRHTRHLAVFHRKRRGTKSHGSNGVSPCRVKRAAASIGRLGAFDGVLLHPGHQSAQTPARLFDGMVFALL